MSKFIIPTENELRAEFRKRCEELLLEDRCEECRYNCRYNCLTAYIYDVLTFRCDQRESFLLQGDDDEDLRQQDWDEWCEQLKPAPNGENCQTLQKSPLETLPAWCKEGQWVLMNNELYKIAEVNGDGGYPHIKIKDALGRIVYGQPHAMCPVRFRAYSYEEAKGLLGKLMEYSHEDGGKRAAVIYNIGTNDGRRVDVHGHRQEFLMNRFSATINGVPFGVPEVDEELLKGGEK
jgi:hypothetical protein